MNWRISSLFSLILFVSRCRLQSTTSSGCPPCQSVQGESYAYVLAGSGSSCTGGSTSDGGQSSDGCIYRYEGTDDLYCFSTSGYVSFTSCPQPKEYFLLAAGDTDQNTPLSTALVYDSDWGTTSLPDLPISGGSIVGGITGDKILLCTSTQCYSWSGSSAGSWTQETAPPFYSLPTAITTYQGVWFSGGIPLGAGRKKRNADSFADEPLDEDINFANLDDDQLFNTDFDFAEYGGEEAGEGADRQSLNPFEHTFLMTIDKTTGVSTMTRATPDLTESRFYHCGIENGDDPIISGGISLAQVYFSLVEQYNVLTGQVTQLPSLNVARTNHGCARFRMDPTQSTWSFIVAGGWFNGEYTSKVEILHEGASSWVFAPDLPNYRLFTAMLTLEHQAYLVGGGEVLQPQELWAYQTSIMMFNATVGGLVDTNIQISPGRKSMAVFNVPRQVLP